MTAVGRPDDGASDVVVFGAGGVVGRRIASELLAAGLRVVLAGRRAASLEALGLAAPVRVADASDASALAAALAGTRLVINAAGPLLHTAEPVLAAALAARAHYMDVGGEQAVLRTLVEHHESAVRRAGLLAVPGVGFDGTLGDLAAMIGAAQLGDQPLDEIAISYVFDDLVLSAGSQRAVFAAAFTRPLVWNRDRWEAARTGEVRRIDAGPAFAGRDSNVQPTAPLDQPREAIAYAGGSPLTLPRHLAVKKVATYASTTRRASGLVRLVASALPLVPRAAGVLAAYVPPDADYARTKFAVVAQLRRGGDAAQVVVRGQDLYATTAAITAGLAMHLLDGGSRQVGMRAPGEVIGRAGSGAEGGRGWSDPHAALTTLGERVGLTVETSVQPT